MKYRKNGVPKISKKRRKRNFNDPEALRDLLNTLYLYIGHYEWKQLTTEQKELLADVVDAHWAKEEFGKPCKVERWWRA